MRTLILVLAVCVVLAAAQRGHSQGNRGQGNRGQGNQGQGNQGQGNEDKDEQKGRLLALPDPELCVSREYDECVGVCFRSALRGKCWLRMCVSCC